MVHPQLPTEEVGTAVYLELRKGIDVLTLEAGWGAVLSAWGGLKNPKCLVAHRAGMGEGHTYVFSRSQRLDAGAGAGRIAGSCVHGDSHQASSFGKRGCPQHSIGLLNTGAKCTY